MSKLSIADEIRVLQRKVAEIEEKHRVACEKEVAGIEKRLDQLYKQRQTEVGPPALVSEFLPSLWGKTILEEAIVRQAATRSMQDWRKALEEEIVLKAVHKKS